VRPASNIELVVPVLTVSPDVNSAPLKLEIDHQSWPLDKPFRIARGVRTEARVIVVTVSNGQHSGRGEAVPSARYGETISSTIAQLEGIRAYCATGFDRQRIQSLLPPGAARNALDCALWDLEAKISGKRIWELANLPVTQEVETAFTISLDTPDVMATAAEAKASAPILKLKLGGDNVDLTRVQAVREKAPATRLLIDANESGSPSHYRENAPAMAGLAVELIEQPFPAKDDEVLETLDRPVPVCADESCHTSADLPRLTNRYDVINVKLDKTGGLTEALLTAERARRAGFKLLIGCMVCTSLGIAPARLLASTADYVDLDGPLLLAGDRPHGLFYENGRIGIPSRELWG
jgi:L-Ala-D/L-Glu epimerase